MKCKLHPSQSSPAWRHRAEPSSMGHAVQCTQYRHKYYKCRKESVGREPFIYCFVKASEHIPERLQNKSLWLIHTGSRARVRASVWFFSWQFVQIRLAWPSTLVCEWICSFLQIAMSKTSNSYFLWAHLKPGPHQPIDKNWQLQWVADALRQKFWLSHIGRLTATLCDSLQLDPPENTLVV